MRKNLVTVLIPSYNYQRYLGAAIDSVLAQTYRDWELIIVDDASSDDSPAIIERYRRRYPDRIRSILLKENVGQGEAANVALAAAGGEYISFLGADDVARPARLEDAVSILRQRPNVAAAFSRVAYIDAHGRPQPVAQDAFNRDFADMRWQLLEGNFLCATSSVVRRSAFLECGGFSRNLGYTDDYDLWLRLLDRHELVRVDGIWVDYRLHGENLSVAASRREQRLGPLYESVAVAVRAMHRWPLESLHTFRHRAGSAERRRETAEVQMRLAACCLRLERSFLHQITEAGLPSPALGVAAAYGFVLDALQNDPGNAAALALLAQVYAAFGDRERSAGGRSSTLGTLAARPPVAPAMAPTEASAAVEPAAVAPPEDRTSAYRDWSRMLKLTRVEARQFDRLMEAGGLATRFHFATVLQRGGEQDLVATLESLTAQFHTNVLFTVVAAVDPPPGFASDRLRWLRTDGAPLAAVNESLLREEAAWVGLIACGDQLEEAALTVAAEAIGRNPRWQAIYTDDDLQGGDSSQDALRLKPDLDITLLRGTPYADGLVLARWDAFAAVRGFDTDLAGASSYDLLLKIAERGSGAVGHLDGPLLHRQPGARVDGESARKALAGHLARSGLAADLAPGPLPDSVRVDYRLEERPLVSLVIPSRDRLPMLSRCLESILEKTAYGRYEILVVDHGSTSTEMHGFLAGLAGLGESRLRVIRHDGTAFLASALNAGARQARGGHLVFLHDDVAALHPDWLDKMVAHGQRPGIGAVGARLLSADGRLQHAGIVLGLSGSAELVGAGATLDDPGYLGRYALDQEVSAASAACLLVRREAYDALGGFDESGFPIFLPDVDFCLRLDEAGWRIVWTPAATLLHDGPSRLAEGIRSAPLEPADRSARWSAELDRLLQRWLPKLARDPHYNRLHSLRLPAYRLCEDPLLARNPLPWKPLPRVFVQPADRHACGHYRISAPLRALASAGRVQGWDSMDFYTAVEMARIEADTVVVQRPYTDAQLAFLEQTARYSGALRLFDLDDLITQIPVSSVHRGSFPADLAARLKRAAAKCDRLVVATAPLASAIKTWHEDIRVVPNRLPGAPWTQLSPQRHPAGRPRVGWAGALGHEGDLALVAEVIASLAGEVDWVFLGHCPDALRPLVKEAHAPVAIADYPAALAGLGLDVAIAPLEINAFNEAKSHLKLLEYGILGYPVICTDILPYQGDFPVTRVRNRPRDWTDAIRAHVSDRDEARRQGAALRDHVLANWILEDHLDDWYLAWTA